jgi:cysteine sulfinate desulfinase/cysteine desulfurase-like protein
MVSFSLNDWLLWTAQHHSNLVPWQLLAQRNKCVLKFVQLDENEMLDMAHLRSLVTPRTKLVSLAHVSNTLGCLIPTDEVVSIAKVRIFSTPIEKFLRKTKIFVINQRLGWARVA